MTAVSRSSVASSQLKLWQPSTSGTDEKLDELSLRAAFQRFLEADVRAKFSKGTMTQYRVTIGNWERSIPSNPGIGHISDFTLEAFRDGPMFDVAGELVPREPATINKDLRTIHAILRRVGPRADGNPSGKGILTVIPYCARLDEDSIRKRLVTRAELLALYKACEVAKWPARATTGVHPARLWRALFVCLLHWGANKGDLFRLTDASITPGDGSIWKPLRKLHYVEFVRKKTKGKKPDPIILPVARTVLAHLQPLILPGQRIFRFPNNGRDIKRTWELIHEDAGIPLVKVVAGEEVDNKVYFQDLRKTCSSLYDEIDPGIGEWVLGHAPRDVNKRHYAIVVNRLRRAVRKFEKLKQPKEFRGADERQQRLC